MKHAGIDYDAIFRTVFLCTVVGALVFAISAYVLVS